MNIRSGALLLAAAIAACVAAITIAATPPLGGAAPAGEARPAPQFRDIDKWLNSEPLAMDQLRGKVRQKADLKDRLFEIEFFDAGAQAYAFTFG